MGQILIKKLKTYLRHKDDPQKLKDFYQSYGWRKLSYQIKASQHFICERCWSEGVLSLVQVTHHIKPIRTPEGWNRRLDPTNLVGLCAKCHEEMHHRHGELGSKSQKKQKQQEQIIKNRAATLDDLFNGG